MQIKGGDTIECIIQVETNKTREKELLNALGKYPTLPLKDLVSYTSYKRVSSIIRKINELKRINVLSGPAYTLDYGKLCKNPVYPLVYAMETEQDYETVTSYLHAIGSLTWIRPVLSPYKKMLLAGFISSNDAEIKAIFQLLKDNNIITDFGCHGYLCKKIFENPNFFGDSNPSLDNLLDPCIIPDMSFGQYDTAWSTCDVSILPYLLKGYKDTKLIEILRAETKLHKPWTYEQIKYSYKKMVKNGLIEKRYTIFPYSRNECAHFSLVIKTKDIMLTQRILYNFGRGTRIHKRYILCEPWGVIRCASHPLFLTDLMYKLDSVDEITEKELYQWRSNNGEYTLDQPLALQHFDVDTQTLYYPYQEYKEQIKERIECG